MPEILVKEFSDIATTSGLPKLTKIRNEKHKDPYEPAGDYYKKLREAIIDCHKHNLGIEHIEETARNYPNRERRLNYVPIASAYTTWHGDNSYTWFDPPRYKVIINDVTIVVNPELGLAMNGEDVIIKLYFLKEAIPRSMANYILYLMERACQGTRSCKILDIKRKKLLSFSGNHDLFEIACTAETAYINSIWGAI
jgi:hypothetical protein